jgi:hypothetical protein
VFPNASGGIEAHSVIVAHGLIPAQLAQASPLTARPNILASTPYDISMPPGASTVPPWAVLAWTRKPCRNGSGTPRSR